MGGAVNLYGDDVEFIESNLMGVTHPEAFEHYDFAVEGRRRIDDRVVYDVAVASKGRLHAGFVGTVAVLDEEFVLLEADLRPARSVLATAIPFPMIEFLSCNYRQQFRSFAGLWLPVDYRLKLELEVGTVGLQFPLVGVEQVTRFANYQVNGALSDSAFAGVGKERVDAAAVADTAFRRFADPVPLTWATTRGAAAIGMDLLRWFFYNPPGRNTTHAQGGASGWAKHWPR